MESISYADFKNLLLDFFGIYVSIEYSDEVKIVENSFSLATLESHFLKNKKMHIGIRFHLIGNGNGWWKNEAKVMFVILHEISHVIWEYTDKNFKESYRKRLNFQASNEVLTKFFCDHMAETMVEDLTSKKIHEKDSVKDFLCGVFYRFFSYFSNSYL